jgi:hypothetical protein
MAEPVLSMDADDDLPRTIRRERDAKEAREREAQEREARERLSMEPPGFTVFEPQIRYQPPAAAAAPAGAAIGLDVPFSKLMTFFIKAVFAAIPALIILTALLWVSAVGLQALFPDLVKLKVLIYMPK